MKNSFAGNVIFILLCHSIHSMKHTPDTNTPEGRQILRNQRAFAAACADARIISLDPNLSPMQPEDEKIILDGSIDFDFPYEPFGRTQLSIAARSQHFITLTEPSYNEKLIQWLMAHNADPNILDRTGRNAALWSIGSYQGSNKHPISLFVNDLLFNINQEFSIENIQDELQTHEPTVTYLSAACLNTWKIYTYPRAQYALIKLLIEHGADPHLPSSGKTALQIAEELGDQEMVKILREKNE